MKVASVEEMRNLDKRAMEEFGIVEELLMENAGCSVFSVILNEFGTKNKKFVVVCGVGNNGGDGLVVARKIHSNGGRVKVFILGDPDRFKGAAKLNYEIIRKIPIEVKVTDDVEEIESEFQKSDAIVDAIFGTGLSREVGGLYERVINAINRSGKTVFSVDIPSGVNGNTGEVMGVAVKANYTITFGLPKLGNILYPGFELCGKLFVCHISFPPEIYSHLKTSINLPEPLPPRGRDTHKGNFGKALFISGSSNYFGAPYFSAMSFLKAGGGLSYLATPKSVAPYIAVKGSEIVFRPQEETGDGSISLKAKDKLIELSKDMDIVVIGPGLSLNDETKELVRYLVKNIDKPVLIDGDGLTAISEDMEVLKARKNETILTPHPGEMSRLTGKSVGEIKKEKVEILRSFCKEYNSIVVLKGAHTLICSPDGYIYINPTGNPGMATAGSGDVLTGAISAMFCMGFNPLDAARMGVFLHGLSGDIAASKKGEDGITAGDILEFMPDAMVYLRERVGEVLENCYGKVFSV